MAERQGAAEIHLRKGKVAICAGSAVAGVEDEITGVWRSGLVKLDLDAFLEVLPVTASEDVLGLAMRTALRNSQLNVPWPDEWRGTRNWDFGPFLARLSVAFGLASPKALYSGMRYVSVEWLLGDVTLKSTRRRHGGRFEGFAPAWRQGP